MNENDITVINNKNNNDLQSQDENDNYIVLSDVNNNNIQLDNENNNNIQLQNENNNNLQMNDDEINSYYQDLSDDNSSDSSYSPIDKNLNESNELGMPHTNDEILEAMNGSINDLKKIQKDIEQEILRIETELNKHIRFKEWHQLTNEAGIKEIEYRENEILGVDAMKLPDVYEVFLPALKKVNPKAAEIAQYLFPFQGIQFNCLAHKNIVPFSDEFLRFFKFLTICIDLWSLQFREACSGKPPSAGDKHHWNYHAFHFMEHHRFSPGWMDDQRTEATMKVAMQWFKKYKNHLNKSKASTMMLGINTPHLIKFDKTNQKELYSQ